MTKNIITSAVVALVVAFGLWCVLPAKTPVVGATNFGNTSIDGSQSNLPNPSNYDYLVARLALGLGTNISNSNTGVGNINVAGQKMNLVSGTSTPCAIQNPLNATSTISSVSMNITVATSSAITWSVGSSTTAFATTSNMETVAVAAGAQQTITWDPGADNAQIAPRDWVVIGASGATAAGTGAFTSIILGGTCQIVLNSAS